MRTGKKSRTISSSSCSKRRINLLVVVPSLVGGGAERVVTLLLQHINRKKFEPTLVMHKRAGVYLDELPSDLRIIDLGLRKRTLYGLPNTIWRLARIIRREKPNAVLSFLTYCNLITIAAARLSGVKTAVVVSERIHLTMELKAEARKYSLLQKLGVRALYPLADRVVANSRGIKKDLVENFGVHAKKVEVIYNPVDIRRISRLAREPVDHPWFRDKFPVVIAVGRLEPQKGYPYLLRAFARVKKTRPCRLVMLGEGEERRRLEHLAQELGIEQDVAFLGFQKNPFKYLARADVFVLSSLWEGFPNVIIEAMVCGMPVIASNCPGGPGEIIENGSNGLLVPPTDERALADAILSVLDNPKLAKRLVKSGKRRAQDFSINRKIEEYEKILEWIAA
jgi:glycosyltransferase involved in cell wall biosynthesis